MLGIIYLVIIIAWVLIMVFVKCKKTITPHFAFADNYTQNIERHPSVHVIQLQPDDINDNVSHYVHSHHHSHYHRHRRSFDERSLENTFPTDAIINPAYVNDEEFIINAPPPSYDEVMRQPDVYPKVHEALKSNNNNI